MKNFKTQTQGGLGTCYANALSAALSAELGEDISYQQLAMIGSGMDKRKINDLLREENDRQEVFVEGGDSCTTFNRMKESNKNLCRSKDFPLENMNKPKEQGGVFKSMIHLYQRLYNLPKDERIAYAQKLQEVSMESMALNIYCFKGENTAPKPLQFETFFKKSCLFAGVIARRYDRLQKRGRSEKETLKLMQIDEIDSIKDIQKSLGTLSQDENTGELSCQLNNNVQEKINSIKGQMGEQATSTHEYTKLAKGYLKDLAPELKKIQQASLPVIGVESKDLSLYLQNKMIDDLDNIKGEALCAETSIILDLYSMLEREKCVGIPNPMQLSDDASLGAISLMDLGMNVAEINKMLDSFEKALSPSQYLMSTLGGSCDEKGIKFPKELRCVQKIFPSLKLRRAPKDVIIKKSKAQLQKYFRDSIQKRDRPLMISLCTGFMRLNQNEAANFSGDRYNRSCDTTKKHGQHAMSIIGHRCVDGKVEYEIQNSWGAQCDSYNEFFTEKCDPETGRFYIPEEMLINNMNEVEFLK